MQCASDTAQCARLADWLLSQQREYLGIAKETNAYNPMLCTNTQLEQDIIYSVCKSMTRTVHTHRQWGKHSLEVCVNVNRCTGARGVPLPMGV